MSSSSSSPPVVTQAWAPSYIDSSNMSPVACPLPFFLYLLPHPPSSLYPTAGGTFGFVLVLAAAYRILLPWPGIESGPLAVRTWSLNPQTTRESPEGNFKNADLIMSSPRMEPSRRFIWLFESNLQGSLWAGPTALPWLSWPPCVPAALSPSCPESSVLFVLSVPDSFCPISSPAHSLANPVSFPKETLASPSPNDSFSETPCFRSVTLISIRVHCQCSRTWGLNPESLTLVPVL